MIQKKVIESNMNMLLQTRTRVENILQIVDYSTTQFMSNYSLINRVMEQEMSVKNFTEVRDVVQGLRSMHTVTLGVSEVHLVNVSKDWIINYDGMTPLSSSEKKMKITKYMNSTKSTFWIREGDISRENEDYTTTINAFEEYGVCLVKKWPLAVPSPTSLIHVKIPAAELNRHILDSGELGGQVLILDKDYYVIGHEEQAMLGKDTSRSTYIEKLKEEKQENGYFTTSIDGKAVCIAYNISNYNDWIYLSVIPLAEVTKESRSIGLFMLILVAFIVITNLIFALFGSKKIYTPIGKLYDLVRGVAKSEDEREKDEVAFIRDNFDRLIKNKTQMNSIIKNQTEQLKEFFVFKLLNGEINNEELMNKLKLFPCTNSWKRMCVLVLQVDTLRNTSFNGNDREIVSFALKNIISDLIIVEQRLGPVFVNEYLVALIGSEHDNDDANKRYVYSLGEMIQKAVNECLEIKVSIGISKPYIDFLNSSHALDECFEALKYSIRLGQDAVLCIEDVLPQGIPKHKFPKTLEKQIVDAVKYCDEERAHLLLNQFIEQLLGEQLIHDEYIISLSRLLMDLIAIVQDEGERFDTFFNNESDSILNQLFSLRTTQEIEKWFTDLIHKIVIVISEQNESQQKSISEKVISIIEEEYCTDLTVESCAAKLNYHPGYIRRIFNQEVGINFSTYLTQYRINMAKKWLGETDLKIFEIAEKLRYNNSQNFIRCFRKTEGITPGQYRQERIQAVNPEN